MAPNSKSERKPGVPPEDALAKLSLRERLFVLEYQANGGNATRAAIAANYSVAGAAVQGTRMLRTPKIRGALEGRLKQGRVGELELTIERLEEELARITYLDPRRLCDAEGHYIPLHELPEDVARAIAGIDVESLFDWVDDEKEPGLKKKRARVGSVTKYRFPSKVEAIHLGMRRRGALVDRAELDVKGNIAVSITINGIKREPKRAKEPA